MHPFAIAGLAALGVVGVVAVGYFVYKEFIEEEPYKQMQRYEWGKNETPREIHKICVMCKNDFPESKLNWSKTTKRWFCTKCSKGLSCTGCGEIPTAKYKNCRRNHRHMCLDCLYRYYNDADCPEEECRKIKKKL